MKKISLLLIFILKIATSFSQEKGHPYGDDGLFDKSLYKIAPQFVLNNKYGKSTFTYCFVNYTNKLTQAKIEEIIASSFEQWQKASGGYFTFTYTTSSSADFKISFATGNHGDGYPFDGYGGVLAHAFYPPPNGGVYAGQLHFDDDENWTDNDFYGFNLFNVATHEIGHLLGLAHSSCTSATMYSYYFSGAGVLNADDIAGIRTLYNISNSNIATYIEGTTPISCSTTYNFTARASNTLWNTSPNLSILNQTSNSIIVYPNTNGGVGTITAVGSDCGNSFTTQIQVPLYESHISGPSSFCATTETYTIDNLPTGTTVSWSITGSYSISGSSTSDTVTVQRNSIGYGALIANITTTCGSYTVTKNLIPLGINPIPWANDNGFCGVGDAMVDVPSGTTLNWEVTGDLAINFGGQTLTTTENIITVTGTSGTIIVTGTACGNAIYLDCNYEPYKREITVAANPMIGGDPLSASIQNADFSYTTINWYIDGVQVYNQSGNSVDFFNTSYPPCGAHTLSAKAVLSCGLTAEIGSVEIERYCRRDLLVYPNPSNTELNIAYPNETNQRKTTKTTAANPFSVKLFNEKGKVLREAHTKAENSKGITLQVADIPNGIYYLHIYEGKNVSKQQIVIAH